MRVALCGESKLVEQVSREVASRLGVREVTAADLPWPERFDLRSRRISWRHPAVQRLGVRLSLASARTGYVLTGMPTDPAALAAVVERARRLDVAPSIAIAVGRTPESFDLVEQSARDVLRVSRGRDPVPIVLSYLSTFAQEPVPEQRITVPSPRDPGWSSTSPQYAPRGRMPAS